MKHEIEGIPEGFDVIDARIISNIRGSNVDGSSQLFASIIVRKKQPRRIVFEETDIKNAKIAFFDDAGMWTYWKIAEDNKCAE